MTDEPKMTFEELASAYFELKEKAASQEAEINDYKSKIEGFEQSIQERDARISHLQTIIVDHVGTSERPKDKGPAAPMTFSERYKAMIDANIAKE